MDKFNNNKFHFDGNKFLHHILINRVLILDDAVKTMNDAAVNIIPNIEDIINTKDLIYFNGRISSKYICNLSLKGTIAFEYTKTDNTISIFRQEIIEEEYIELPFLVNKQTLIGEVKNIYTYLQNDNELYISIYFLVKM